MDSEGFSGRGVGADDVGINAITRRQLIAGSVVAGGLAWAAPTLLSSPAAWATHCPCGGIKTTAKLPSDPQSSVNCGVQCLSHREGFNFPCLDEMVDCLIDNNLIEIIPEDFVHGQVRRARVILKEGISLLAVGAKSDNECYFAECDNGFCPNSCLLQSGDPCTGASDVPPNRVVVCPGGSTTHVNCTNDTNATTGGGAAPNCGTPRALVTEFIVDMLGDPINAIEVALCIPNRLTQVCP